MSDSPCGGRSRARYSPAPMSPLRPTRPARVHSPVRLAAIAGGLAAALAARSPAAAQSYSDPGTGYGAEAGYATARDAESAGATGGVHARLRLTGGLGVEVSAGYRRDAFAFGGKRVLSVDEVPVEASLLVFFLHGGRVQPYALAGAGYTWAKPKGEGSNAGVTYPAENLFTLHAGAGVDVRTGFRTSVFLDGRYVFLDVAAVKQLPNQPKADHIRLAAGFNVYF
jgi:opacity protein-like surface antigen